tara:strand:- start:2072 stop:2401 length:330 start_codon:yes stop_codon:yes gene_type:complete
MKTGQGFLKELYDKLWRSADKMRFSMDAAKDKRITIGVIFRKYVSDVFEGRQTAARPLSSVFLSKSSIWQKSTLFLPPGVMLAYQMRKRTMSSLYMIPEKTVSIMGERL